MIQPVTMQSFAYHVAEAKEKGLKFMYIEVQIDNFAESEIIINTSENFDDKLAYYQATYDENFRHKQAPIKVINFGFDNDLRSLELYLNKQ